MNSVRGDNYADNHILLHLRAYREGEKNICKALDGYYLWPRFSIDPFIPSTLQSVGLDVSFTDFGKNPVFTSWQQVVFECF